MVFSVAVAGASGYAGGEILRLLANHPEFEVKTVTSHSTVGQALIKVAPHLQSFKHLTLSETTPENLDGHDVVFFALPHGASGEISDNLEKVKLVVDCGADHRLEDENDWNSFYDAEYFPAWSYGVPELLTDKNGNKQRDNLKNSSRIAAPGCNASTVALSIVPGIAKGLIEADDLVSVLSVGPSGAGKALKTHLLAAEIMGSAMPYAFGGTHRHIPEIQQALRWVGADKNARLSFTPVLVPMSRGILATTTAKIKPGVTEQQIRNAWLETYENEKFITVLPAGTMPKTADVLGANTCHIGLAVDEAAGRLVVIAAVDNLVKGTAGAAIQSANIALGIAEDTGLTVDGVSP